MACSVAPECDRLRVKDQTVGALQESNARSWVQTKAKSPLLQLRALNSANFSCMVEDAAFTDDLCSLSSTCHQSMN